MTNRPKVISIFGPTASGKTALSLSLAKKFDGVIVNADSRQIYKDMPIITAMPSPQEMAAAPHLLFEKLTPDQSYSVARYLEDARQAMNEVLSQGKIPIFCGGTGFYLKTLEQGISPMPEVDHDIFKRWKNFGDKKGVAALYLELVKVDPQLAENLKKSDAQRMIRGLCIYEQSGEKLSDFQKLPAEGALDVDWFKIGILPQREEMYERIHQRFDVMIKAGLLDEIRYLEKRGFDENSMALQSLGVKELFDLVRTKVGLDEAREKMLTHTRRYAKRQCTWLRHQYGADVILEDSKGFKSIPEQVEQFLC